MALGSRFLPNSFILWRRLWRCWLGLIAVLCLAGCAPSPDTARLSNYDILNSSGPFDTHIAPAPEHYQPVADWIGRLILPDAGEVEARPGDWVWLQVLQAPVTSLIGQTVILTWQSNPQLDSYVDLVSQELSFDPDARASQKKGNVHPERLNGWQRVGPLQSLAGARPQDDVIVSLSEVRQQGNQLTIGEEPTQIAERFYGLVDIVAPAAATDCSFTCQSFRVRHYSADSQQFDGDEDTIYIPEIPPINGIRQFSLEQLEKSPASDRGWYIYGSPNQAGQFIVRAMAPRRLFELETPTQITDFDDGLNYINFGNWRQTPERQGIIDTAVYCLKTVAFIFRIKFLIRHANR